MKEQILSDKQRRAKRIYGTVGIALTVLCFILSYFYRPYAYSHHLNDFHLADSYTSIFGVPIIVCLTQAFFRKESEKWSIPKNIVYAVLMLFVWEAVDGLLAKRMDWVDMASSILGDIKNERHQPPAYRPYLPRCHPLELCSLATEGTQERGDFLRVWYRQVSDSMIDIHT